MSNVIPYKQGGAVPPSGEEPGEPRLHDFWQYLCPCGSGTTKLYKRDEGSLFMCCANCDTVFTNIEVTEKEDDHA